MAPMLIQEVEDEHSSPPTSLELTPAEGTLRRLLLDVATHIDQNLPAADSESHIPLPDSLAKAGIVLRITGGWVRDKLLGVPSHDIDVAINKMTGEHFALRMKEYLDIPGNLEKYGLEGVAATDKQSQKAGTSDRSKLVGGLHKIEANPEKSKHLETVTTRILGLDIDLVNLRKETYSDESRTPQMEFGTAEEDALRRDATVNAMFYNLNTEQIEDFTGRGHDDMRDKVIRTPLEPYQTFQDDPLRVLRLIRFASRLHYKIDPEALEAMRNVQIQDALRRKISRERVGTEIEKAFRGPDPPEALRLIFQYGLYETIFSDTTVNPSKHYIPSTDNWETLVKTLNGTLAASGPLAETLVQDAEERFLAWQLLALVPYRDAPNPEPSAPGKKVPPPIAASVAREGIKATNKVCDIVVAAIRNQAEIAEAVDKVYQQQGRPDKQVVEGDKKPGARDVLGLALRRWGASWHSQIIYSFLVEVANLDPPSKSSTEHVERKYTTFITHLTTLDLLDVVSSKPLLDGKQLAKALNASPGPWMRDALDVIMAWQLRNPDITDPAEAVEAVRAMKEQTGGTGDDMKGKKQKQNGEPTLHLALALHFLRLTIRPLFSRQDNKANKQGSGRVTEAGRKITSTNTLPEKASLGSEEERPWRESRNAHALDLLRWVIATLPATTNKHSLFETLWPLIIPPVLTLIDDREIQFKILGVQLLTSVLHATTPEFLARTGLASVFEESLLPCFSYLPDLTAEEESIALLNVAVPAMLELIRVRSTDPANREAFPTSLATTHHPTPQKRTKLLTHLLRTAIFAPLSHCPPHQHPSLASAILSHLPSLVKLLGPNTILHLRDILPLLTEILSHALVAHHLPLLLGAVQGLQVVVVNARPRIVGYRGEVAKGLSFAWLGVAKVEEEGRSMREDVQYAELEMRKTVGLLREVMAEAGEGHVFERECEGLVEADGRLEELFVSL